MLAVITWIPGSSPGTTACFQKVSFVLYLAVGVASNLTRPQGRASNGAVRPPPPTSRSLRFPFSFNEFEKSPFFRPNVIPAQAGIY